LSQCLIEFQRLTILERLAFSEGFETFLATKFPSAKRFGLEGGETLIPGMKAMIDTLVENGCSNVVMGMAHRGRLNVLANVLRKPAEKIVLEFMGALKPKPEDGSGDVKYERAPLNTISGVV
jgi:2-oxoglutarate dehydrogenase E1 component